MSDHDTGEPDLALTDAQLAQYRALYSVYVSAFRKSAVAELDVRKYHIGLLDELSVPAGMGIDVWGDGTVKPKGECAPAPEAI